MMKTVTLKEGIRYTEDEVREKLIVAANNSGLSEFYDFGADKIVLFDEYGLKFLNNKVEIQGSDEETDPYLHFELELNTLIAYFSTSKDELYILEVLKSFVCELEKSLGTAIDIVGGLNKKTINNFILERDICLELLKLFPGSTLNLSTLTVYIKSFNNIGVYVGVHQVEMKDVEVFIESEDSRVMVTGTYTDLMSEFEDGLLIEKIKSVLLGSIYEGIKPGYFREYAVDDEGYDEITNMIGNVAGSFDKEVVKKVCVMQYHLNYEVHFKYEDVFIYYKLVGNEGEEEYKIVQTKNEHDVLKELME